MHSSHTARSRPSNIRLLQSRERQRCANSNLHFAPAVARSLQSSLWPVWIIPPVDGYCLNKRMISGYPYPSPLNYGTKGRYSLDMTMYDVRLCANCDARIRSGYFVRLPWLEPTFKKREKNMRQSLWLAKPWWSEVKSISGQRLQVSSVSQRDIWSCTKFLMMLL